MQGNKNYTEVLFNSFQLSELVPEDNLLPSAQRCSRPEIHAQAYCTLSWYLRAELHRSRSVYEANVGGYLEYIIRDRKIMAQPRYWHSTLSRTWALLLDSMFTEAFEQVMRICMDKGMVSGHTQASPSAPAGGAIYSIGISFNSFLH